MVCMHYCYTRECNSYLSSPSTLFPLSLFPPVFACLTMTHILHSSIRPRWGMTTLLIFTCSTWQTLGLSDPDWKPLWACMDRWPRLTLPLPPLPYSLAWMLHVGPRGVTGGGEAVCVCVCVFVFVRVSHRERLVLVGPSLLPPTVRRTLSGGNKRLPGPQGRCGAALDLQTCQG